MVNQETAVRGFVLGGNDASSTPTTRASPMRAAPSPGSTRWRAARTPGPPADLSAARRAIDAWETGYAQPTMERIHRLGAGQIEAAAVAAGKARFDAVRTALARLRGDLQAERSDARAQLASAATRSHVHWCSRPRCCWPR